MQKVLIFGGNGFIGKNIISLLKDRNYFVGCYDLKNINIGNKNYVGNIIDDNSIDKIVASYDVIIYLVGNISLTSSMKNINVLYNKNISALIKVLDSAHNNNIKRVIFASSGGTIYGNIKKQKLNEKDENYPINHYGIYKLTCEKILEMYNNLYQMENISLRLSNVFGNGQNPKLSFGVIAIFVDRIKNNLDIDLYGKNVVRDFIDVKEVAEAFYLSINFDKSKIKDNLIFNIGSSNGIELQKIIKIIEKELNKKANINYYPKRIVDVKYNVLDITKAQKYLGFNPSKNQEQNIIRYIKKLIDE